MEYWPLGGDLEYRIMEYWPLGGDPEYRIMEYWPLGGRTWSTGVSDCVTHTLTLRRRLGCWRLLLYDVAARALTLGQAHRGRRQWRSVANG